MRTNIFILIKLYIIFQILLIHLSALLRIKIGKLFIIIHEIYYSYITKKSIKVVWNNFFNGHILHYLNSLIYIGKKHFHKNSYSKGH